MNSVPGYSDRFLRLYNLNTLKRYIHLIINLCVRFEEYMHFTSRYIQVATRTLRMHSIPLQSDLFLQAGMVT